MKLINKPKTKGPIINPIKPSGPTVLQMGAAIIEDKEKTFVTPSRLNFQAMLIIIIANGNSYAIIVAISLCAPTVAYGDPDENPPITIESEGIINKYNIKIKSP